MEKENKKADEKEIDLRDLKERLQECQKQKEEYLAGWQRSRADLLNYKKEEMERIGEIIKYANTELILKILPLLDDLERAEKLLSEDLKNNQFIKGILQIRNGFRNFLKNQGIQEIKAVGEKFDPNFHEVIEEIEVKDKLVSAEAASFAKVASATKAESAGKESGIVIEEVQKGYILYGKVLRPARVKISK